MTGTLPGPHPNPDAPRLMRMPPNACDSHCHVFGPHDRFPLSPDRTYDPAEATLADYRRLQGGLGMSRAVFVQPAAYGRDHACLLQAIASGPERFRGAGLVDSQTSNAELALLARGGVLGARFNFMGHLGGASADEVRATSARVAGLGWHIVLHVDGAALVNLAPLVAELQCPVVIDHMARLAANDGVEQVAFRVLLDLLALPHVWAKISAADRMVANGQVLDDAAPFMAAIAAAAPERTLWGTDWPHPNSRFMPNDGHLVDLLARAIPDPALRQAILARNPARLFNFAGKEDGQ